METVRIIAIIALSVMTISSFAQITPPNVITNENSHMPMDPTRQDTAKHHIKKSQPKPDTAKKGMKKTPDKNTDWQGLPKKDTV